MRAGVLVISLLLACCVAVTIASTNHPPLHYPRVTDRIVGGNAATIDQFPWIVSMQYSGQHRCGGAIVSTRRILTAAHCTAGMKASSLSVRAGATYSAKDGQLVQVVELRQHPKYNARTYENDLCVMVLEKALDIKKSGVRVVPMPRQDEAVRLGAYAYVAGWGHEKESGMNAAALRAVSVPLLEQSVCKAWYKGALITDGMLCAGYEAGGKDACQNDSGGPLTVDGLLVGIVSWGTGCARPKQPGVYARVAYYRDWIDTHMDVHRAPVKVVGGPRVVGGRWLW